MDCMRSSHCRALKCEHVAAAVNRMTRMGAVRLVGFAAACSRSGHVSSSFDVHALLHGAAAAAGPLRQDLYKAIEVSSVDAFQVCAGPFVFASAVCVGCQQQCTRLAGRPASLRTLEMSVQQCVCCSSLCQLKAMCVLCCAVVCVATPAGA